MPGPVPWYSQVLGLLSPGTDASRGQGLAAGWRRVRADAFGAEPVGERLARIRRSPHFVDGAFRNPVPTRRLVYERSPLEITRAQLASNRVRRLPAGPIPVHPLTSARLAVPPASGLRLTWLGHASVLAELDGRRVLFDPVWGVRCSPFPGVGPKRLHPVPIRIADLGPVDVVVISHDHYDHLDMTSVRALIGSGAQFAAPLGVGAHLEHWGVPAHRITELDWWESAEVAGLTLTAAPARHYCSRGPRTSTHFLWASWAVAGPGHRIFHSGDSGYFPGFAEIGGRLGPFDATMMQIGAYSPFWPEVHMTPEEGVRAHLDAGGATLLPIHWCTFNLAQHPWEEPAERTVTAAQALGATVAVPRPGASFEPADPPVLDPWWRAVAATPSAGPPVREPAAPVAPAPDPRPGAAHDDEVPA